MRPPPCPPPPPFQLNTPRLAYGRASNGPAATMTPADLHQAKSALDLAEKNFAEEKGSQKTVDLAYIAERTAQIAEARAQLAIAEKSSAKAKEDFGNVQGQINKDNQGKLASAREQLGEAERSQAKQGQIAKDERAAREDADRRAAVSDQAAKDANDALAKLAAKEDARGLVITLSGSVLFRTNDPTLLSAAQTRLDQVASALVAKKQ